MKWHRPTQFSRELRKLGLQTTELAKVAVVMDRFAKGKAMANDHKVLRDGVEELRIDGHRRIVRLYFARIGGGLVLLCLHVQIKKKDLDRDAVSLAVTRLAKYKAGEWGDDPEE